MKTLDPLAGISAFLAVAETSSFSRAADRLAMSRPTVSAQVQELERRMGVRLLQRTTRSVALTEAGEAYYQALSGVLPQIREAERAATSFQQEAIGRIRVSAPPDLGSDHLAPLVAEFLKLNPGISIDLDLSMDAVNLVEEKFDLAIRGTISIEPNVVTRQIGASPIQVCATPDYVQRHGRPERPEDLARHACLHFARLRWGRVWHFSRKDEKVRVPVVPRFECNEGRSLLSAALAGAGVALLPGFVVGPAVRAGRLAVLLEDWAIATIPIHAVYPANRHIAAKVKTFVGFLADRLGRHPDILAE
ncbi:LysR substrate-binding domain-containing protein [Xanthobacter autotrophicus DSM 431]|uniref:LysR family transcriptional regulator n=1 Tax=Xanthobacter nonsaccharivorans TaxID=3119912 RepID=UPI00372A4BB4